jgi:hypothetical protein
VIIYLKKRNGETYETYIDLEDFDKVDKLHVSWHIREVYNTKNKYARYTTYLGKINGKEAHGAVYLHQLVLGVDSKTIGVIDHINHNTLDNRKSNLRIIEQIHNTKNRQGKNSNNTSGYRNVSKIGKWWVVQLQIEGKNTQLKKFPLDQVHEAGAYAEEMRKQYYGDFSGES